MSSVAPGQKQFTASVWVITATQPKKVLLLHHKKLGRWMQPGGHIEPFENPVEAAVRETLEETGIDISSFVSGGEGIDEYATLLPRPLHLMEQVIPAFGEHPAHVHLDLEYVVEIPEQPIRHNPDEAEASGWFTAEEVDSLHTFQNVKVILKRLLAV